VIHNKFFRFHTLENIADQIQFYELLKKNYITIYIYILSSGYCLRGFWKLVKIAFLLSAPQTLYVFSYFIKLALVRVNKKATYKKNIHGLIKINNIPINCNHFQNLKGGRS